MVDKSGFGKEILGKTMDARSFARNPDSFHELVFPCPSNCVRIEGNVTVVHHQRNFTFYPLPSGNAISCFESAARNHYYSRPNSRWLSLSRH